jgi:hypothetical protein
MPDPKAWGYPNKACEVAKEIWSRAGGLGFILATEAPFCGHKKLTPMSPQLAAQNAQIF